MTNKIDEKPPILRKFRLIGLNGYKNVGITLNSAAKIAAADNGSGKTSLLNAIYAVFSGRASLLYSLEFEQLEIVWGDETIDTWRKRDLFGTLNAPDLERLTRDELFVQWDVQRGDATDLLTKYVIGDIEEVKLTSAYKKIYRDSPYDNQEILDLLASITNHMVRTGGFLSLHRTAKTHLRDCSVLYLPTYRRIEADIAEFRSSNSSTISPLGRARQRIQKDAWNSTKLIFFGMSDVENKIDSIVTQIREETLEAYSRSNGQTLEELVENLEIGDISPEIFDIPSIEIVLSRVGKGSLGEKLKTIIETKEITSPQRRELRRFLIQLLRVYAQRRSDEEAISDFVTVVNGYLSPNLPNGESSDGRLRGEKSLFFDKLKLEVSVENRITKKAIEFGVLSSGEKQIVSIFARLLLDPRRKYFVLVDEPELSLSIDWQQKLLPDIFSSPNCVQLIAITHSPFIHDNELEVVAGSIESESYQTPELE